MTQKKYMLVSDIDGTLLGDDTALDRFADWYREHQSRLRLVYNSGRFIDSIQEVVHSTGLPEPDAMIGGVGTQIELAGSGQLKGWPRTSDAWDSVKARVVVLRSAGIQPQPPEAQTEFKVSFYTKDLDTARLVELQRDLMAAGLSVEVVYSSNRDLDILPAGVNKGAASSYLASHWNVPPDRVAVAGDTGNDESMFLQGFRGIVVGNAQEELKSLNSPDIYHAPDHSLMASSTAWPTGSVRPTRCWPTRENRLTTRLFRIAVA